MGDKTFFLSKSLKFVGAVGEIRAIDGLMRRQTLIPLVAEAGMRNGQICS